MIRNCSQNWELDYCCKEHVSSSFTCIIYYTLQTDRLKLIFAQVMCSEDNQECKEYLTTNSVREGAFKIVMFCLSIFAIKL